MGKKGVVQLQRGRGKREGERGNGITKVEVINGGRGEVGLAGGEVVMGESRRM